MTDPDDQLNLGGTTPPGPPPPEDKPAPAKGRAKSSKGLKVGDTWTLPKGANIVVLPDGTAATARGQYGPLRVEGTYKAIGGDKDVTVKVTKD